MNAQTVKITNSSGKVLSAKLELPADQKAKQYAIFAHCFTCSKDLSAVRNISRSLTQSGFGVLRFDFTGLGNSDGEFSETNFSSNVQDLLDVATYLEQNHQAPSLMVGHSLGGSATIVAAAELASVKAVVTIGSPAYIDHIEHMFEEQLEQINASGSAEVSIGGRPFTITKQFVDDLKTRNLSSIVANLKKAYLICHSPQDTIVTVDNAATLYEAAKHPKSFLSLDGADHLLSNPKDSNYVGQVIGTWSQRYIEMPEDQGFEGKAEHVSAHLGPEGYTTQIKAGKHAITADEPASVGGNDFGPSPYELLGSALAACTVMTLRMYAKRKGWDLQEVLVHISHDKKHVDDCEECEKPNSVIDVFEKEIELIGNLDEDQRKRLLEIADKCPVNKTLLNPVRITKKVAN